MIEQGFLEALFDRVVASPHCPPLVLAGHPVTAAAAADAHTLAGTSWARVTGHWPLDHRAKGIHPTLARAELHAFLASRCLPLHDRVRWPAARNTPRPIVPGRANDRPTAAEPAETISALDTPHQRT
ncbi:hypothetical protein [Streptomyces albipurpureus]|uniref:Uncharacterized protein n=1 Tax=Streptomyces albipurpureus TaxID=2897419 RepID=A0ABT0ULD3_9ACTN|nr:hypothetical protein [Streptomyces sp. CWNU-1]MCM2388208.1 hypothetical protein [Streptomyces sp. CWNU-1]